FERLIRWDPTVAPPGGETVPQVFARVKGFLDGLEPHDPDGTYLVVAHSGTVRMLASALLNLPAEATRRFALDNASLSVVETHPRGSTLALWNDTSHYRRTM
ncbi:MAG: histidine phosphatase family protein, partial [SAR202 cluster bacterium]|nr:histidine phosphatase family protein [SAR202 cluster bacterium]